MLAELDRHGGGTVAICRQLGEAGAPRGDESNLRHREQTVQDDQAGQQQDFHARGAPPQHSRAARSGTSEARYQNAPDSHDTARGERDRPPMASPSIMIGRAKKGRRIDGTGARTSLDCNVQVRQPPSMRRRVARRRPPSVQRVHAGWPMFDSPFEFCSVCRQYVLLDQTEPQCAREHACLAMSPARSPGTSPASTSAPQRKRASTRRTESADRR